jgi:hypothetical protein
LHFNYILGEESEEAVEPAVPVAAKKFKNKNNRKLRK